MAKSDKSRVQHAALLAAVGMLSGSAHALIIDDFGTDASVVVSSVAPASGNAATADSGAGMIGDRTIIVNKTTGASGFVNAATAEVGGGVLGMANGPVTNSIITSSWVFGATDLTEGGTATGLFLALPSAIDNDLNIAFSINGGAVLNRLFPNGSSGNDFFIPFADFANAGAATSATSLSLVFSDGPAWDAQIDFIETRPETPSVPAPGTLALLGLGFVALATRRNRKQQ